MVRDFVLSPLRAQVQSPPGQGTNIPQAMQGGQTKQIMWQLWKSDPAPPPQPLFVVICYCLLVGDFSTFLVKSVFSVRCGSPKSVSVSLVRLCFSRVP